MNRIGWKLSFDEFKDICRGINSEMCIKEILQRWQNYTMFLKTTKDGRTAQEVGASIREEEFDD